MLFSFNKMNVVYIHLKMHLLIFINDQFVIKFDQNYV
jgi:hypothetical protein